MRLFLKGAGKHWNPAGRGLNRRSWPTGGLYWPRLQTARLRRRQRRAGRRQGHSQVISNSAPVTVEQTGDTGVHTFATTPKMSTYLVALVAG